jgi:hypothetical protein
MSAPLDDLASYSAHVYSLRERHAFITGSTLTLAPVGATVLCSALSEFDS